MTSNFDIYTKIEMTTQKTCETMAFDSRTNYLLMIQSRNVFRGPGNRFHLRNSSLVEGISSKGKEFVLATHQEDNVVWKG